MGFFANKSASLIRTLGVAALTLSSSQVALAYWTVQGNQLIDRNGQPFVFRGVTIDHTLSPENTVQAIKDVAATGANAVQIEFPIAFYNGFPRAVAAQLKQIVLACKDNKLICVLESNDISGYPEGTGSQSPDIYAGSWIWDDFLPIVAGREDYIIIGLGNQALGNSAPSAEYKSRMYTYLGKLRGSLPGFMLMVDGNMWGQDIDKAMVSLAEETRAPGNALHNVIFSIDMFDKYSNPEIVRDYIARFKAIGAPLIIGGFAPTPYYHPNYNGSMPLVIPQLPAASVMQYAQEAGVGYFAWSWSGNKNSALDLVSNWNPTQLTHWGDLVLNGANGIKATAKTASIFNNSSSSVVSARSSSVVSSERAAPSSSSRSSVSLTSRSSSSSTSLSCPPGNTWPDCPRSSSASSRSSSSVAPVTKAQCSYVINSQWNNGFTATIRIKNTSSAVINGWNVNWQYSDGSKVTNLWNATLSGANPYNAKNLSWNSTIQPGQTVEFGFQGNKSAAAATVPAVTGAVCQ